MVDAHTDRPRVSRLRMGRDDAQEVRVCFGAARASALIPRLIQVATALHIAPGEKAEGAKALVTKIETDFARGCVVVTAVVSEQTSAEQVQLDLLRLVPPA